MKKAIIISSIFAIVMALFISIGIDSLASDIPEGCEKLRCTCYLPTGNKTADGSIPYEGICASNREHLGQVAVVYDLDMNFIGYFECRDTGSHKGLVNGTRIDIYRDSEEGVKKWQKEVGDYIIVQWVKGEG